MIIRRKHNGNFTIVPNALVDDKRLSIEAKGLLAYLISRPNNWTVRHSHLHKELGIGRDKLQRILRELIRAGYLERDDEQPRDDDNQFAAYHYICRDVPISTAPPPLSGFPLRGSRQRKTRNGNKNDSSKTELNKTPTYPPPSEQAETLQVADDELPFEVERTKSRSINGHSLNRDGKGTIVEGAEAIQHRIAQLLGDGDVARGWLLLGQLSDADRDELTAQGRADKLNDLTLTTMRIKAGGEQ
jgi:hypothetical protein